MARASVNRYLYILVVDILFWKSSSPDTFPRISENCRIIRTHNHALITQCKSIVIWRVTLDHRDVRFFSPSLPLVVSCWGGGDLPHGRGHTLTANVHQSRLLKEREQTRTWLSDGAVCRDDIMWLVQGSTAEAYVVTTGLVRQ